MSKFWGIAFTGDLIAVWAYPGRHYRGATSHLGPTGVVQFQPGAVEPFDQKMIDEEFSSRANVNCLRGRDTGCRRGCG